MITNKNFSELLQTIHPEDIQAAIDGPNDYILMECHIFNVGAFATIENTPYDETIEEEAAANGNLFTDKDSFLSLCDELEAMEY